jgi:ribosomal protein S18 acetylase RimI-like enzyme
LPVTDPEARARAWYHGIHAEFCDLIEPWKHGTVVRASRYPNYYDLNAVRVEEDPGMSAEELAAFADEVLAGLRHRRIDFEDVGAGEPLRKPFEALGWLTERLVWMRHDSVLPPAPDVAVEEIPYDDVIELRANWHREDFPAVAEPDDFIAEARDAADRRGAQVLGVRDAGEAIAFAQVEHHEGSAEVSQVYVHPDHRGRGLGTAITCAAIRAGAGADDLWIIADDEGRPRDLYARLGFVPVWQTIETLRLP